MTKPDSDYAFDGKREGYVDVPRTPMYAAVPEAAKPAPQRHLLSIRATECLGSLIAAAGTIWATYAVTVEHAELWRFQILSPGPVEVCGLGILLWLHGKWRRATQVR